MTPEQAALILGALGSGGVLVKIVDAISQGLKDSRSAKDSDPDDCARSRSEAAFLSEKLQETRELYLREGGDPEKLGPPPRFKNQISSSSSESK